MYSMVLMMALSNGAAVPANSPVVGPMTTRATTHEAYRCHGCCGGYSGCCGYSSCHGYSRCHGCYSGCSYSGCCGGWYGGMSGCCGGYAMPVMKAKTPAMEKPKEEMKDKDKEQVSAPATIQVSLPADAKLTIDGAATSSTSSQRSFQSPALEPGKDYYYTLKAEVVRDGKTLTATARVSVRPGAEARVDLSDFRDAGVASR
jgi:uncharacterized protein (TIGR03000 family)